MDTLARAHTSSDISMVLMVINNSSKAQYSFTVAFNCKDEKFPILALQDDLPYGGCF